MKKLPMRRIVSLPVLAAFVVLGASCSQQVQQPVKKAVPPPVYVGKVEQVYPNHHYVLIALAGNVYEPGTVLISQSPGREEKCRVANLIVTEERMGRARIPADIAAALWRRGTWCSCIGTWLFRKVPERWMSRSRSALNRKRMKTARLLLRRLPRTAAGRRTG